MGLKRIPHQFINDKREIPDADKLNNNFSHVNLVPLNRVDNGDMELFTAGASSPPDSWALSGTGATVNQSNDSFSGSFAALVTFGTDPAFLRQLVSDIKALKGGKVKAWAKVKSAFPNVARLRINDGVGQTDSPFHTGDDTYQHLEVIHDVAAGASQIQLELRVESNGSAKFDEAVIVDFKDVTGFLPSRNDLIAASSFPNTASTILDIFDNRPAAPTRPTWFWATDLKQMFFYDTVNNEWNDAF